MSRSRNTAEESRAGIAAPRTEELSRMMFEGRSWSGYERTCCFLNLGERGGEKRFANVAASSGLDDPDDGRAVAVVDWDQDGDLDLWMSNRNAPRLRLMRNESRSATNPAGFLQLRLRGTAPTTSRDAIGARVEVRLVSGARLIKTLRAGESFLTQSSKWLHFGLGHQDEIESAAVHWPGGERQELEGLTINSRYLVTQGEGCDKLPPRDSSLLALTSAPIDLPPPSSAARIPAITRYLAPSIRYRKPGHKQPLSAPAPAATGRWLLVNLWASWCAPCHSELEEFTAHASDLKKAGIDLLALSVDTVSTTGSGDPAMAQKIIAKLNRHFTAGFAEESTVTALQQLDNYLTALAQPLPVPCSFLIDPNNRVAVIYKGVVSVDRILADAKVPEIALIDRWQRAAALPGSMIDHPAIRKTHQDLAATLNFRQGKRLETTNPRKALHFFSEALREAPEFHRARTNLGKLLAQNGRDAEAIQQLQYVVAQAPDFPNASFELAMMSYLRGRVDEAMIQLSDLLQRHPDHAATQNNLAWLLATHPKPERRDLPRALELARAAVTATKGELPDYLDTLAVAQAGNGRFEEATATLEQAIVVAEASDQAAMIPDFKKRLEQFRAGKAYGAN